MGGLFPPFLFQTASQQQHLLLIGAKAD